MPYVDATSLIVRLIEISVALAALLVVASLAALLVVRTQNGIMRRRQNGLNRRWRDVFVTAYTGATSPHPMPRIGQKDAFTVLQLFEQFHDIRDTDRARASDVVPKLDAMAHALALDDVALDLLKKGDDADKILALNVLGHLREARALAPAVKLSSSPVGELARAAAYCALRIDPAFAPRLLELVRDRDEWARARVEMMLRDIEPEALDRAMIAAFDGAVDAGLVRLLDYLRFCSPPTARDILRKLLRSSRDIEVVAAALRSLAPLAGDPDRDVALRYCRSSESVIAISALRVLRKCVRYEDRDELVQLTANRDYWVRLRAAEVVVQLYGDTGLAEEFAASHPDRFARDAIRQALAERKRMSTRRANVDRRGSQVPA